MNTLKHIVLAITTTLLASSTAHGGGGGYEDPRVDGEAIVRIAPGFTVGEFIADFQSAFPGVGAQSIDVIPGRDIHHILLTDWTPELLDTIEATYFDPGRPMLTWGEMMYEGQAPEGKTGSTWVTFIGGDQGFNEQYVYSRLGMGEAQTRTEGGGVVVAVLDTGLDATHPVFGGVVLPDGYNFIADSTDTSDTGDGVMVGHGTFVAGLINLVAPQASLLPVVVLNSDGVGDEWSIAEGLFFAVDRGVDVINLSLTSTYSSNAVEDALDEARNLGIVSIAAAGNEGLESREFPAGHSGALSVAAVDDQDVKADFSNFHQTVFITAPGTSFESAPGEFDPERSIIGPMPNGDYASWEGTSFATPLVSGLAALLRAQHPGLPHDENGFDTIEAMIAEAAVNIDAQNPGFEDTLGAGRIDIGAASALGLAESFSVAFGTIQQGNLEDLHASDDSHVVVQQRAALSPLLPMIELEAASTSFEILPSQLIFCAEASATALPAQVPQRIDLLSFTTGSWRTLDERLATLQDSLVTVVVDGLNDPAQYIQPGSQHMRSRIRWFDPGAVFFAAWASKTDRVVWTVVP